VRASVKEVNTANDNLIDSTIAFWIARSRCEFSRNGARQMVKNVAGFFSVLFEWSRREIPAAANDQQPSVRGDKCHER
jgi:hypothetical protein